MGCLVCVLFLKIIVCKDDKIPAFSSTMKIGLNYLHLTNWLHDGNIFLFSLVALRENMSHVTCHDVSRCLIGSQTSCDSRGRFRVHIMCLRSRSRFAFVIRDTIGRGMTWDDVTTNSFAFSRE